MRRILPPLAVLVVCAFSAPAPAQTPTKADAAKAQALFEEARALMGKGKVAEACPKLEKSQALDPAPGTEFNLADCYERIGRPAPAWKLFMEVADAAKNAGHADKEKIARERAQALEAKMPMATVEVAQASRVEGLTITRDGQALGEAAW